MRGRPRSEAAVPRSAASWHPEQFPAQGDGYINAHKMNHHRKQRNEWGQLQDGKVFLGKKRRNVILKEGRREVGARIRQESSACFLDVMYKYSKKMA